MNNNLFPIAQALPPFSALPCAKYSLANYRTYYQLNDLLGGGVRHIAGQIISNNLPLALQAWLVDGNNPTALCVHGYYDHSGWSKPLIHLLLAQGYNVCCLDLPGHGLSSGERVSIQDFDEYGAAIASAMSAISCSMPAVSLCIGHSTGAAAWLNYCNHHPAAELPLILMAPLLRPSHWQSYGRYIYPLLRPFTRHYPRKKRASTANLAFNRAFAADPLVPNYLCLSWIAAMRRWLTEFPHTNTLSNNTLIIQGQRDDTVDWRYNLPQLISKLPRARVEYLAEARHQLINETPAIKLQWQAITLDFLKLTGSQINLHKNI